jgi:predicted membrane protein
MLPHLPGLILVGIGALFLLDNLGIVRVSSIAAYWPVILIAVGMVRLVDSTHSAGRIAGGILLGLGALLLAENLGYIPFPLWELWPLILIGIGLAMLWNLGQPANDRWFSKRNWGQPGYDRWSSQKEWGVHWARERFAKGMPFMTNTVNEYAVFGASRRVITDQDFKGGKVASVFGGVYLDLSGANMSGNSAVLEMSSVYGGATVIIPASWNLEVHAAGIFGGFVDRTVHPPVSPDMKRLIVRGAAVFGGVTFKN